MPRTFRGTLAVATAVLLVASGARAATPPQAVSDANFVAAVRSITDDAAVRDLVARSKQELSDALRAGGRAGVAIAPLTPGEVVRRVADMSATPLVAAHSRDAATVARINAVVQTPAYQQAIGALADASTNLTVNQVSTSRDQYLQAVYLVYLMAAQATPMINWGSIAKVVGVVAGAVAVVAGAIACGVTVVCLIAAGAGAIAVAAGAYLLVAEEATHSLNIADLSCGNPSDCVASSTAYATSTTLRGSSFIGGASWTFKNSPTFPTHTLSSPGTATTWSQTGNVGGARTYSLTSFYDGGGTWDNTHCFPYVTVEVQVVWNDNSYSLDERTGPKPTNPSGQYC